MVSLMYILFICIVAPLSMMLFLLDKKPRLIIGYMIIGMIACVFISEINSVLLSLFNDDIYYVTTNITPVSEEIIKALAVVYFAFVVSDDRNQLLTISLAVGIGFAIMENSYILMNNVENVNYIWAIIRGFSAGFMHGLCTAAVGYGISFVRKKKKLFYTGTFGLLIAAVIYHSIYNTLVQSQFDYLGFILPMVTFIPIFLVIKRKSFYKKSKKV